MKPQKHLSVTETDDLFDRINHLLSHMKGRLETDTIEPTIPIPDEEDALSPAEQRRQFGIEARTHYREAYLDSQHNQEQAGSRSANNVKMKEHSARSIQASKALLTYVTYGNKNGGGGKSKE